jgi:hypothetical protein
MFTFSSVQHLIHWAFLLRSGAPLEVRGRRAHVAHGTETRTVDIGDMSETDLRSLCAAALRDAHAALTPHQWAALCARFGHGETRAAGLQLLVESVEKWSGFSLADAALALFRDVQADDPNAKLLAGVRAALVAHALAALQGLGGAHVAPAA